MSVMLLSLDLYKEVFNKACGYKYNKTVDINYCRTLSIPDYDIRTLLKNLYELNAISYNHLYGDKISDDHVRVCKECIKEWNWEEIKKKCCNTYQMLKYLQCIEYQISYNEIKDKCSDEHRISYELLCKSISELQDRIIEEIPAYQEAKWSRA